MSMKMSKFQGFYQKESALKNKLTLFFILISASFT